MLDEHPGVFQHILLATDFSAHADRAAYRAKEIAERYSANLTLLHTIEEYIFGDEVYDALAPADPNIELALHERAVKRLSDMAGELGLSDARQETVTGVAHAAILEYIEAHEVDLVVMGTHGHKGIGKLLGSTASAIVNKAICEVLVVPLK
jgi:universal stress protein A